MKASHFDLIALVKFVLQCKPVIILQRELQIHVHGNIFKAKAKYIYFMFGRCKKKKVLHFIVS